MRRQSIYFLTKNVGFLVISMAFMISCDGILETGESTEDQIPNLKQTYASYDEPDCQGEACAQVKIKRVEIEDNYRLNEIIEKEIISRIEPFTRQEAKGTTEAMIDVFFNDFKDFKSAFPESKTPWELDIVMTADYTSMAGGILSIYTKTYSYTGGAHPNTEHSFLNLSLNGKKLRTADLIAKHDQLLNVAESAFRSQLNIPSGVATADAGYEFENDQFHLPENIGFEDGEFILIYNAYEIASYADGAITISIPVKKVAEALRK